MMGRTQYLKGAHLGTDSANKSRDSSEGSAAEPTELGMSRFSNWVY